MGGAVSPVALRCAFSIGRPVKPPRIC